VAGLVHARYLIQGFASRQGDWRVDSPTPVDTGARFPAHNHPGGEQIFILEGDLQVGRDRLKAGDYLYTPPNGKHAASTEGGCVVLVTLPRPIEILEG